MAKKRAAIKQKTKTKGAVQSRPPKAKGLDQLGASYARLLVDPCGAPLVHPVYPGGDAGFLFRADSVLTLGAGTGETSGVFHWTPGYVNTNNTELVAAAGTSSAAALTAGTNTNAPGKSFLTAQAFGARCVAACVKVSFPGAESSRSGRVHYGHTTAGTIDNGDSITVDGVAPLLQHYTRTPPEILEVYWRPGIADTEFNDPNAAASAALRDRKSAMTVAWAGLPAAIGMTFHLTAIYEWTPKPTTGVSTNTSGKNPSANTMDEVIDYIQRMGFNWVRNAAGAAGHGMVGGAVSAISNYFGLMPAAPMNRQVIRFR